MNGNECRRPAPGAEGGPVGFFDGGNRWDWFPGGRGSEGRFKSFETRCQTLESVCMKWVALHLNGGYSAETVGQINEEIIRKYVC